MQAGGTAEKAQAENMLSGALKSLFAVAEAYPELKANQNFLELQRELSDTENKIQASCISTMASLWNTQHQDGANQYHLRICLPLPSAILRTRRRSGKQLQ